MVPCMFTYRTIPILRFPLMYKSQIKGLGFKVSLSKYDTGYQWLHITLRSAINGKRL